MNRTTLLLCMIFLLSQAPALAQEAPVSAPTPAQQRIAQARTAIDQRPQHADAYAKLAMALAQRARETADTAFYTQAEQAIERSLALAPGNLEARRVQIWVMLGRHEFQAALEAAQVLNLQIPDDVQTYAYLTDANIALGRYAEAERAAQWMLDLRPGNIPGLTRAAYLRELFGDLSGSLDLMSQAYQRTPPSEHEDRAWLLTHMAHLEMLAGQAQRADDLLSLALQEFPAYHYAIAQLAKLRQVQGRSAEALDLLRRHVALAPHAENLFYLGESLQRQGLAREAARTFKQFEKAALAESRTWDNANRELTIYYADYARRPADALRVASFEIARRQDVHTLDAYAWALYRNGKFKQAHQAMSRALAVGTLDPGIHRHARVIALKAGLPGPKIHPPRAAKGAPPTGIL